MHSIEVRFIVFNFLSQSDLIRSSYVNKQWNIESTRILLNSINLSNLPQINSLQSSLTRNQRNAALINHLTLAKSRGTEEEINPDILISFLNQLELKSLHLFEPSFNTLRRRQLNLGLSRYSLNSLAICGRKLEGLITNSSNNDFEGFNLNTIGLILNQLPALKHLELDNIHHHSSALIGLIPPTFELISLSLKGNSICLLSAKQFEWLFKSTCWATREPLLSLKLEWNKYSPKVLNTIRYLVLRVERLEIETNQVGVIESFMLHFPSLQHLTLVNNSAGKVDVARLIGNLEIPFVSIIDNSPQLQGISGTDLVLELKRDKGNIRQLKSIKIKNDLSEGSSTLMKVCAEKGIGLKFVEW